MILSYIEGLKDFKNNSGKVSNSAAGDISYQPGNNIPEHVDKNVNTFEIKFQAYKQQIEKERFKRE